MGIKFNLCGYEFVFAARRNPRPCSCSPFFRRLIRSLQKFRKRPSSKASPSQTSSSRTSSSTNPWPRARTVSHVPASSRTYEQHADATAQNEHVQRRQPVTVAKVEASNDGTAREITDAVAHANESARDHVNEMELQHERGHEHDGSPPCDDATVDIAEQTNSACHDLPQAICRLDSEPSSEECACSNGTSTVSPFASEHSEDFELL